MHPLSPLMQLVECLVERPHACLRLRNGNTADKSHEPGILAAHVVSVDWEPYILETQSIEDTDKVPSIDMVAHCHGTFREGLPVLFEIPVDFHSVADAVHWLYHKGEQCPVEKMM